MNTAAEYKAKWLEGAARIYGRLPERPVHLTCESESIDSSFAAGKATLREEKLLLDLGDRDIFVPFVSVIPKKAYPLPVIINLSYENALPNKYLPAEEIVDRGYAIFSVCIDKITDNSPNFKSGIAPHVAKSRRKRLSPGKIALWAWVAIRLAEYAASLEWVDKSRITAAGQGLLARAALLAGGYSDEIKYAIGNCISESPMPFSVKCDKSGLTVRDFSYLYSPALADDPGGDELDVLLSITADKSVLLGFCHESDNAPSCEYVRRVRGGCSVSGKIKPESEEKEIPTAPIRIQEENLSYHMRGGTEYFSREDWNIYLDFIDKNA